MEAITINELHKVLSKEIERGNGNKKLLVATDDEGNGYHPMFYAVSPTLGNVGISSLYGVSYRDAIENYMIIG